MTREQFADKIGLPKMAGLHDWFALPLEIFITWFKWEDNADERKVYLKFDPPIDMIAYYDFIYSLHIKTNLKFNKSIEIDLNITDNIHCCNLGCFMGRLYYRCLDSPKSGVFVNLIDLDRFKGFAGKATIKKGEILFYVDYSHTHLKETIDSDVIEKLCKLRELAKRGIGGEKVNAERMFYELLKKYNIQESELPN